MNNAIETLLLSLRNIEYIELFVYIFIVFFVINGCLYNTLQLYGKKKNKVKKNKIKDK